MGCQARAGGHSSPWLEARGLLAAFGEKGKHARSLPVLPLLRAARGGPVFPNSLSFSPPRRRRLVEKNQKGLLWNAQVLSLE
jgi:hypothetical protein